MNQRMFSLIKEKNFCRKFFAVSLILSVTVQSFGQTDPKTQAVQRLQDLAANYRKADHLSFKVTYRYSSELRPASFLDSLTGSFKLNGNSFWYGIDNAEFLGNDSINIAVFN